MDSTLWYGAGDSGGSATTIVRAGGTGNFLPLTGGTVTNDLTVQGSVASAGVLSVGVDTGGSGSITLNGAKQTPKAIYLRVGGKNRWIMQSDVANETGGNFGSNFALSRYDDAGNLLGNAMTIGRVDGTTQFYSPVYLSGDPTAATGAATKQYVDTRAPLASPTFTGTVRAPTFVADTGISVTAGNITAPSGNVSGVSVSATTTMTVNGVNVATTTQLPVASSTTPLMNGTAAVGTGTTFARNDHVHPTDTSRLAVSAAASTYLPLTGGSLSGALTVNGITTLNSSNVIIVDPANAATSNMLTLQNSGSQGASMVFAGNGATTPNKYLQAFSGQFRIINSAYSTAILTLSDAGDLTIAGGTATKPGGGSWAAPSDARIKDVSGNYEHGLAEVCALQPVRYRYKSGVEVVDDDPKARPAPMFALELTEMDFIGLVAQDTEPYLPECVGVSERTVTVDGQTVTDVRTLDTGPLIFALVNAVRELRDRVVQLEAAAA